MGLNFLYAFIQSGQTDTVVGFFLVFKGDDPRKSAAEKIFPVRKKENGIVLRAPGLFSQIDVCKEPGARTFIESFDKTDNFCFVFQCLFR